MFQFLKKKHQVVVSIWGKLSQDAMAKEIFSIYICTKWAPSSEFVEMLKGEISTDQLPKMDPEKLYRKNRFIPLRCSENFQVFSHVELGVTSFETFEKQMQALAEWYQAEKDRMVGGNGGKMVLCVL